MQQSISPDCAINELSDKVKFVRRWQRLGGGSDQDILATFGVSARRFFTEVLSALDRPRDSSIPASELEKMKRVCRARVWLSESSWDK
jgi:hypothetical protein